MRLQLWEYITTYSRYFFISFVFLFICNAIEAECINGNCKNGNGTFVKKMKYKSASVLIEKYSGKWKNGLHHGKGKLWQYSLYTNTGTLRYFHNGLFKRGKAEGYGIHKRYFNSKLETECKGSYRNAKKEGKFHCKRYIKGILANVSTIEMRNNKRNGKGVNTYYWPNGKVRMIDKGIFGGKWIFKGTSTKFNKAGKKIKVEQLALKKKK